MSSKNGFSTVFFYFFWSCKDRNFLFEEWWNDLRVWGDVHNCANPGMEVMQAHNAHNFPLELAAAESTYVAIVVTAIYCKQKSR